MKPTIHLFLWYSINWNKGLDFRFSNQQTQQKWHAEVHPPLPCRPNRIVYLLSVPSSIPGLIMCLIGMPNVLQRTTGVVLESRVCAPLWSTFGLLDCVTSKRENIYICSKFRLLQRQISLRPCQKSPKDCLRVLQASPILVRPDFYKCTISRNNTLEKATGEHISTVLVTCWKAMRVDATW